MNKTKVDCFASNNNSLFTMPNQPQQLHQPSDKHPLINPGSSASAISSKNSKNHSQSFVSYSNNVNNTNNSNDNFNHESHKPNEHYDNLSIKPKEYNQNNDYSILRDAINNAIFSHQTDSNYSNQAIANNNSKQKMKPGPLIIPSAISAFQHQNQLNSYIQQQQQQANMLQSQQQFSNTYAVYAAAAAAMASHIYPNATLLKSPRLLNYDFNSTEYNFNYKKQYTPPPMLSPFRKGPGLFCNSKQFASFFSAPPPLFSYQSQQHAFRPTPQYNHSMSDNHLTSSYIHNNYHHLNTNYEASLNVNRNIATNDKNVDNSNENEEINYTIINENISKQIDLEEKTIIQIDESSESDKSQSAGDSESVDDAKSVKPVLISSTSFLLSKPSLKRPRICNFNSFKMFRSNFKLFYL